MLFPVFHCLVFHTSLGIHHYSITDDKKENKNQSSQEELCLNGIGSVLGALGYSFDPWPGTVG